MAVKNATLLLDDFCAAGIAIEVTHRSKRRLFGLTGLAPLRDVVRPPYRPEPGRGRGRPPLVAEDAITVPALPPVPPLDRQPFDYSDLAHWMTQMDQTIRQARRALSAVAPSTRQERMWPTIRWPPACPTVRRTRNEYRVPVAGAVTREPTDPRQRRRLARRGTGWRRTELHRDLSDYQNWTPRRRLTTVQIAGGFRDRLMRERVRSRQAV